MLKGDKLPNFKDYEDFSSQLDLNSLEGKKVVLYFYPKDNTPGCTTQACNIRDNIDSLKKNNIVVIGISADSIDSHAKFKSKYELPFPLISDSKKVLINIFGVWGPKKFMGRSYDGIHRKTFLFDESGFLVDVIEKPKTKFHADEIINAYLKSTSS
jgi:peroxiredoxin Q/BCP